MLGGNGGGGGANVGGDGGGGKGGGDGANVGGDGGGGNGDGSRDCRYCGCSTPIMICFCFRNLTSPIMTCLACALRRRRCNVCNENYELVTPHPANHPPPTHERVVINHPDGWNEEYWRPRQAHPGNNNDGGGEGAVGDGGRTPEQCSVCQLPENGSPGPQGQLPSLPFISFCGHMEACSDCSLKRPICKMCDRKVRFWRM